MTEAEKKQQITLCESEIKSLNSSLQKYKNMKEKIEEAIPYLTSAKSKMNEVPAEFKKNYNVNGISRDEGKLKAIIDKIVSKEKYLKETILSSCDNKINIINSKITTKKNELTRLKNQLN